MRRFDDIFQNDKEELSKVAQYCEQDTSFTSPPKSASSKRHEPSDFGLHCRHRLLADHFGDVPESVKCRGTCDVCADPLAVAREIEHMRSVCAARRSGLGTASSDEFPNGDPDLYGGGRRSANRYAFSIKVELNKQI